MYYRPFTGPFTYEEPPDSWGYEADEDEDCRYCGRCGQLLDDCDRSVCGTCRGEKERRMW